jgi:hypothetical protein
MRSRLHPTYKRRFTKSTNRLVRTSTAVSAKQVNSSVVGIQQSALDKLRITQLKPTIFSYLCNNAPPQDYCATWFIVA